MAISSKKKSEGKSKEKARKTSLLQTVFLGCGFTEVASEGIEFSFRGDASEFDFIFFYENLVVFCEETTRTTNSGDHFRKKKVYASLLSGDLSLAMGEYCKINPDFEKYLEKTEYQIGDLEVRFLYYSSEKDQETENPEPYKLFSMETARYFEETIKTIGKSAKYEMLKFLDVTLSEIGGQRISGRPGNKAEDTFDAFALSGLQTNYPQGFLVVSFYADPISLMERAYVLRRHGWENPEISYQRMLDSKKLREMRSHLSSDEKVYVNNLIITLPEDMGLYETLEDGVKKQITPSEINSVKPVKISLPKELATIGIIDGQHRIYSYHEGVDEHDGKINRVRRRQNLLVTGIVFPRDYTDRQKVRFEAELFLKINDTQTAVSSSLRQEIETIVNPLSGLAIAKGVVDRMAKFSAVKGELKTSVFDKSKRIATASIVRYILKPMVDPSSRGANEFYKLWCCTGKKLSEDTLQDYIRFCNETFNEMLVAVKINIKKEKWKPKSRKGEGVLSPTLINGLLVCLRELISNGEVKYDDQQRKVVGPDYEKIFEDIDNFEFGGYTSSHWAELGRAIYKKFFS